MQERYLGDSHDFLKYALLRHINADAGLCIGINWYLTKPDEVDRPGNNDGQKRHHLKGGVWQDADPDLFEKIHRFDAPGSRTLANVAGWGILPADTIYFDEPVRLANRPQWHQRAVSLLADAGIVFLDPDNGFEVKSVTLRTRPKYSCYAEVADYLAQGQAVVAIQFARQCDPVARAKEVRQNLIALYGQAAALPVIRGRVAPNILFFAISPDAHVRAIREALANFVAKCAKAEMID